MALARVSANDPECDFVRVAPGDLRYLGELEGVTEGDWVEYRPQGEHRWEALGEGGEAAEIDEVLAGIEERKAARTPEEEAAEAAAIAAQVAADIERQQKRLPPPDPDDPRLDWRNWSDEGYVPPSSAARPEALPSEGSPELVERVEEPVPSADEGQGRKPRKPYRKRQPKPPFTPPDEARKAEAIAAVEAVRSANAAAEAKRRKARARRRAQSPG